MITSGAEPSITSPPDPGAIRRVLLYSHDGTGLGHLRIVLSVATAYAKLRPQDSLLLVTASMQAGAFPLPENLDFIKIPAMPRRDIYASLPPTEGFTGSHNSTIRFRSVLAKATVEAFDPHMVVVDHAPAGLFRELDPAIGWLRNKTTPPAMALLMRDITFGPEQTRGIWRSEEIYPLLDEVYDRILIYGDRRIFDPVRSYAMSDAAAARTRFCGYLAPARPERSRDQIRASLGVGDMPLVVVSVGGGADGGPLLQAYLTGLAERQGPPLTSYIATGPLLPEADRQAAERRGAALPNVHVIDFDPDFASAVSAADVVVCMGGYNSMVEAVYFGKRPVAVPRMPGPEEQILRVEGFARLGLATLVQPDRLNPATLWKAIEGELDQKSPPIVKLPFDGLDRIASELSGLAIR